tara:strand:+ start:3032 stop:3382 length:351 start_codon:yes stop_codon:yes gene_type:complete
MTEINPRTGKPYSTNPRAVRARKARQLRKSEEANKRQAQEDLKINPENQPIGDNVLTPEQIEINKQGAQTARDIINQGGHVKLFNRPNLKSLAIGTGLLGIEALKILNPFKRSYLY